MSSALRKIKTKDGEINLKRILQDERKKVRLFFLLGGILFIGIGYYLSKLPPSQITNNPSKEIISGGDVTSFSQEPVKIDKSFFSTKKKITDASLPVRIVIPDLQIDIPVKEAKVINGYWEVFPDSAGWGRGSAYPDGEGNQVIFAHARKGLFLPLKSAKAGQKIYVFTKDNWYSYEIKDIKEVLPTQIEVIAPTSDTILTLYTCTGFADSKRLIVTAKKI